MRNGVWERARGETNRGGCGEGIVVGRLAKWSGNAMEEVCDAQRQSSGISN